MSIQLKMLFEKNRKKALSRSISTASHHQSRPTPIKIMTQGTLKVGYNNTIICHQYDDLRQSNGGNVRGYTSSKETPGTWTAEIKRRRRLMMLRVGRVKSEATKKLSHTKFYIFFLVTLNFPSFPQIRSIPYYHYFLLSDLYLLLSPSP